MRKIFILILVTISFLKFGQQTDLKSGGNYYFDFMSKSELDSLDADVIDSNFSLPEAKKFLNGTDYKITIKKIVGNKVYFTFWRFGEANTNIDTVINGPSNASSKSVTNTDSKGTRVTYSLPVEVFKQAQYHIIIESYGRSEHLRFRLSSGLMDLLSIRTSI